MYYYLVKLKGTQFVDVFESDSVFEVSTEIIVQSDRGLELGKISREMHPMQSMGEIVRIATKQDINNYWYLVELAESSKETVIKKVQNHKLDMDILSVMYNMDQSKVFINYRSDKRVDFRMLLRDLSQDLKTRIELKQLGARDYAKYVGCMGSCGRISCCSIKRNFENVTIGMAKNQMLPLNNDSLSGPCGSLKCCLAYENDQYMACRKKFPKLKTKIQYQNKEYIVLDVNCISEKVLLSSQNERLYIPLKNLEGE